MSDIFSKIIDPIPILGHVKGSIQCACGDEEGGKKALLAATRTSVVIGGGTGGFFIGGPAGAVAGGIYGGAAMDSTTTAIDMAVNKKPKPHGYIKHILNVIDHPEKPGIWVEVGKQLCGDGLTGYTAGQIAGDAQAVALESGTEEALKYAAKEHAKDQLMSMKNTVVKIMP